MRLVVDYGRSGRFPRVSAADVVAGGVPAATFDHGLVLIGGAAAGVGGTFTSPFSTSMPGIVRHASVLDNILREIFVQKTHRSCASAARRNHAERACRATLAMLDALGPLRARWQRPRQLDVIRFRGMAREVRTFEVPGAAGPDGSA